MIGLAGDDVQSWLCERLAVGEHGARNDAAERTARNDALASSASLSGMRPDPPCSTIVRTTDASAIAAASSTGAADIRPIVKPRQIGQNAHGGGKRGQPISEPGFDFVERLGDAAVELHARPAKAVGGQTGGFQFVLHHVIGDFLAAVFEEERRRDVGVGHIAAGRNGSTATAARSGCFR